jgi:hypothetical protein
MQKDTSDSCDSGYLMREKITLCDFAFWRLFFFVAGSRIRNLSKPWPDYPDSGTSTAPLCRYLGGRRLDLIYIGSLVLAAFVTPDF